MIIINSLKHDKKYICFDYAVLHFPPYKHQDRINASKKINTSLNAMYFKTPKNVIEFIVTFFKCIIQEITK